MARLLSHRASRLHNLVTQYPKESCWAEFSALLVRYYKLPHGSRFALKRTRSPRSMRALVRANIKIRRKPFRPAEHPNHDDTIRVSKICQRIAQLLPPHYAFVVIGVGPDGRQISSRKSLQAWRTLPPCDDLWWRHTESALLTTRAHTMLAELDEGVETPEQTIPYAVLQALLTQFGQTSVQQALMELHLV